MRKKAEQKIREAAAMLGGNSPFRLDKVRARAGLYPKVFDKTILDMARLGTIALNAGRTEGLSPAEIGNLVRRGHIVYTDFSFQDAVGPASTPAEIALCGVQKKIVRWIGREYVYLACEGRRSAGAAEEMKAVFARLKAELQIEGLTLNHTIRTRLWAVDRRSRDLASDVRAEYNTGPARAATSSYIMPGRFFSQARVGLDLIALRPSAADSVKVVVESDPPRRPINYLSYEGLLVLAGKTVVLSTLEKQLDEILPRISRILSEAGSGWKKVVQVSCYLHRSQRIDTLKRAFSKWVQIPLPWMEIAMVEGYSAEGKLIEIEVSAESDRQAA